MSHLALWAIGFYKLVISPYLPGVCRHEPTCSTYTYDAIERHGIMKGIWLGTKRLIKCCPLGTSGYDPVP